MRIGLDFGGVIANHHAIKLQIAREMFSHLSLRGEADVIRGVLLPKVGEKIYNELVERFQERTLDFPLYEEVRETMERMMGKGHQFFVVTTQSTVTIDVIRAYLKKHIFPIEDVAVVLSDEGKYEACREFRVEAFLDDNLSVLKMLVPLTIPLFYADFHNAGLSALFATSVTSWEEFEKVVGKLSTKTELRN